MSSREEHQILEGIIKTAFEAITNEHSAGRLPHIRTAALPHILGLAENIMLPIMEQARNDENFEQQIWTVCAAFRFSIRRLVPINEFMNYMSSSRALAADKVLDDFMAGKEDVSLDDAANAVLEPGKRALPGVA
jgi:hypothetical protein